MNFYNKNVLLVIHQGYLGGAERQGLGLSKILHTKYNCTVNVLLSSSGEVTEEFKSFAEDCHIQNILQFGKPYFLFKREFSYKNVKRLIWSAKYFLHLRRGVKPFSPDIIVPFLNFPSKLSYYLYKSLSSVKFTFWHQLGLDRNSLDVFECIAAKNIPCVIANAENGLEMFRSTYKVDPSKLNVLPQYITLEYKKGNKQDLRSKFSIPQNSLVIGMVAHYRPEKYQELLFDVFVKLCAKYEFLHLLLLGNKDNTDATRSKYEYLFSKVKEKNLSSKVSLLSGAEVAEVLNVLDIGVLVSQIEGVPNAVMEYMLYGLPVVATNHSGCKGLLKSSPFLIENKEEQLYISLEKLILSEELRIREGHSNSEKIKNYSMDSYVEKLEAIMNKYLNS